MAIYAETGTLIPKSPITSAELQHKSLNHVLNTIQYKQVIAV